MTSPQQRVARPHAACAGFTLVEALVATALMLAILGALATITAQWLPNWSRGFARVQRSELASRGLERIVADIAAAEFIAADSTAEVPLFDGEELSVTFVRTAIGPNTRRGLEIVRIAETADERGLAVVRTRAMFAPIGADGSGRGARFADPVVLMRAPHRLVFAYAGSDGQWRPTWRNEPTLPAAVRLIIRDAATSRNLAMSTATRLHIDAPANCVRSKDARDCTLKRQVKSADGAKGQPE